MTARIINAQGNDKGGKKSKPINVKYAGKQHIYTNLQNGEEDKVLLGKQGERKSTV